MQVLFLITFLGSAFHKDSSSNRKERVFLLATRLLRIGFGQLGLDSFPDRECVMWAAAVNVAGCNWDLSLNE